MNLNDDKPRTPAVEPKESRRPYTKPQILYREPLEAIANVCSKADSTCPTNLGGVSS